MEYLRSNSPFLQRQRGAVFIVMLVIMIMGVTFFLVSALSKVSLQTARNEKSIEILAQAKEIVIGYALNGSGGAQRPGDLLKPDVLSTSESPKNYNGNQQGGCLNVSDPTGDSVPSMALISGGGANTANMRCLGRLPWKDYQLAIPSPSENDPTGFMPWYAVSANMVDPTCVSSTYDAAFNPQCAIVNPFKLSLNSEILNSATPPHPWLTVHDMNGNVLSNRVAFIIIIPGAALPGQTRPLSTTQGGPGLAGAKQYLDSITVPTPCTLPCTAGVTYNNFDLDDDFIVGDEHRWIDDPANPGKQIEDPNYNFNDKLLYVTIDELMPLIEKRIAREVKNCLDDYAEGNTNNRYPWAASALSSTAYPIRFGAYNVRFGRIPEIPNISTASGTPPTGALLTYVQAVQTALINYFANPNASTLSDLNNAGDTLKDNSTTGTAANDAGLTADSCTGQSCTTLLQNQLNLAMGGSTPDPTMSGSIKWPASCSLFLTSTYWPDWRDLVFYQVAEGFRPGGGTFSALQISGSGNPNGGSGTYRAAVVIAGKKLGTQSRATPYSTPPNDYLSNANATSERDPAAIINAHDDAGSATSFITYKASDPFYQNVNDLVLCLDRKINCK